MKKLLMTTILASTISFGAIADVTKSDIEKGIAAGNSAVCNTLDHGVEFNKTELSQFDKCWLSIHKAEEKSGVSGNIFWVKVGNDFVSMPVKALAQSGSKVKAKEMVKSKIIERVIKVESGTIINQLNADIEALENRLLNSIAKSDITYTDLEGNSYTGQEALSWMASDIIDLKREANEFRDVRLAATSISFGNTYAQHVAGLEAIAARLDPNVGTYARIKEFYQLPAEATGSEMVAAIIARGVSGINNMNDGEGHYHNESIGHNSAQNASSDVIGAYVYTKDTVDNTWNRTRIGRISDQALGNINQAIDDAYDQGYSDGYDNGYADGYRDGFADGVASVR